MSEEECLKEGSVLFISGKYLEAIKWYTKAIAANSKSVKAHSNRSAAYASLEQYENALNDAQVCVEVDKTFVKGYGRLGTAMQGLKRFEEARGAYQVALRLDPTNANYRASMQELEKLVASGAGIAGEEQKRLYYLEQSLKKGTDAMKRNEPAEAVRHFTKALSHCSNADKHTLLANRSAAHFNAGDFRDSVVDAEASATAVPTYSRAFLRKAMALNRLNKLDDARAAVGKALQLAPACEKSAALKKEIDEKLNPEEEAAPQKPAEAEQKQAVAQPRVVMAGGGRGSSYSYCNFCNKHGHQRANCPLRAKR